MSIGYRVYASPHGNSFIDEIAELIVAGLNDLGHPVSFRQEGLPEASSDHVNLVVAPQDYFGFSLLAGAADADLLRAAEVSISITTEQPGTVWFDRSLRYLKGSPLTLDINAHVAESLADLGFPARHLRLGYHPSWDRWGGDPSTQRPVDIGFLGAMTERRERFFAGAASRMWDRRCDLRFFEITRPKRAGAIGFLAGGEKWEWLARTKVLLNVHRSDARYFEWARVLEAAANGCVVVSDPSIGTTPFRAGEHFVEAPLDLLPDYAVGLLADPQSRAEMATAAYDLTRRELMLTDLLAPLTEEMAAATRHLPRRFISPARSRLAPGGWHRARRHLASRRAVVASVDRST